MARRYPDSVKEMLAYQALIIWVSREYNGLYWRVYGTYFQAIAAASGNREWSRVDTIYSPAA